MIPLRRAEIRKLFKRHLGSANRVAIELDVSRGAVSLWLSGKSPSKRIAAACQILAQRLVVEELELLNREASAHPELIVKAG